MYVYDETYVSKYVTMCLCVCMCVRAINENMSALCVCAIKGMSIKKAMDTDRVFFARVRKRHLAISNVVSGHSAPQPIRCHSHLHLVVVNANSSRPPLKHCIALFLASFTAATCLCPAAPPPSRAKPAPHRALSHLASRPCAPSPQRTWCWCAGAQTTDGITMLGRQDQARRRSKRGDRG
jgi:hypothetical protein